jgi:hypothetical protein
MATRKPTPSKPAPSKTATSKRTPKRSAAAITPTPPPDPTSDAALLSLAASFADPPDIPVDVAHRELASLVRLAKLCATDLAKVGITAETIELAARFAAVLASKQKAWLRARQGVALTAAERKLLEEAERLDAKLVAGGRWALRRDPAALAELGRIAEGSGLVDTIADLRDLQAFWHEHAEHLGRTLITPKDLARAAVLVGKLGSATEKESANVDAARALDLRNRAFWAAHALAQDIREGGRYTYATTPKLAAKFTSRYRTAAVRRNRTKNKRAAAAAITPAP